MTINTIIKNGLKIAVVNSQEIVISDIGSALDLIMSICYEKDCQRIALNKEAITNDFFILSTQLAGEILQKFINYQAKFAVYGEFSGYTSKPLKDFIYESNKGKDFFFVATSEEAVEKLAAAQV